MHATGSRIMDMCMDIYIIHCKSYTHASGSRILITCMQRIIIIDICIIHTCIIITCVRIKGICIMHTCTRIEDHIYIHASYIYQGQGLMICIIHACIIDIDTNIEEHIYVHHTHMYQDKWSKIHESYVHALGSMVKYICIIHIIDMCIIHTCIRVKDQRTLINASCIRIMYKCIIGMCIMVTCVRVKNVKSRMHNAMWFLAVLSIWTFSR